LVVRLVDPLALVIEMRRAQLDTDFPNHGEYDRMREIIRGFIANIVAGRRQREARLFDTGVYDATH
jgi:lysozyme